MARGNISPEGVGEELRGQGREGVQADRRQEQPAGRDLLVCKESSRPVFPLALVDCAEVGGSQGRDRAPGAGVGSWALDQPMWRHFSIWRAVRPAGDPFFSSTCGHRVTEDWLQARQGTFLITFSTAFRQPPN